VQSYIGCGEFSLFIYSVFTPAWCSNFSKLSDSRIKMQIHFSLFETVLRECLTFVIFHRWCWSGRWLFSNYD